MSHDLIARDGDAVRKRILLGHLVSNGDCLFATTIARQLKTDFPGCHLTWAISSRCRSILEGNPDVDEVWEVPTGGMNDVVADWRRFESEVKSLQARGDFDEVFFTQIPPANFHLWVGSVRSSIYRAYPRPITVELAPVLRLSLKEQNHVREFVLKHRLADKSHIVLFECGPQSQQSLVTPQFALEIAQHLVEDNSSIAVILSSHHSFVSPHENIVDGSVISLRENAELTKYCSLLIGASSGITWIATSEWARSLPTLQLVIPDVARSNSLVYDFEKRDADTSGIIEMNSYGAEDVRACVNAIFRDGFAVARERFHQRTPFKFEHYTNVQKFLLSHLKWGKTLVCLKLNIEEYGFDVRFVLIWFFLVVGKIARLPFKMALLLGRFVRRFATR